MRGAGITSALARWLAARVKQLCAKGDPGATLETEPRARSSDPGRAPLVRESQPDGTSPATEDDPAHWYGSNAVGLPSHLLASTIFNAHPRPISIHGTRAAHRDLFRELATCETQASAAKVFERYMARQFGLGGATPANAAGEQRRHLASYLDLLHGWGYDSNSAPGAVLKGWVESRFGLLPAFHKSRLGRFPSAAWAVYVEEKMGGLLHGNCIHLQLDLLYEYCQWSLRRFHPPAIRHVRLWRGSNDGMNQIVAGRPCEHHCVLRLNNLVSFSLSRQRAEEFGDWAIEADVPLVKLLCFPDLLNSRLLNSEQEYLVIGGCYSVRMRHGWQ